jgi:hypothetical protein
MIFLMLHQSHIYDLPGLEVIIVGASDIVIGGRIFHQNEFSLGEKSRTSSPLEST